MENRWARHSESKIEREIIIAEKIANNYAMKIKIIGPYEYNINPSQRRSLFRKFEIAKGPAPMIKENDIISSNLLIHFHKHIKNKIDVFGEGAGFINKFIGSKNETLLGAIKKEARRLIKGLLLIPNYELKVLNNYLYLGSFSDVADKEKIKNVNIVQRSIGYKNKSAEIDNIQTAFRLFIESKSIKYFHPICAELSYLENINHIKYLGESFDGVIMIKQHPSDSRDYSAIDLPNIILMPKEFSDYPIELLLCAQAKPLSYVGAYSTTMLEFEIRNVNLVFSLNKEISVLYENLFNGLSNIIYDYHYKSQSSND
jgi:hypothetical protein